MIVPRSKCAQQLVPNNIIQQIVGCMALYVDTIDGALNQIPKGLRIPLTRPTGVEIQNPHSSSPSLKVAKRNWPRV